MVIEKWRVEYNTRSASGRLSLRPVGLEFQIRLRSLSL